MAVYTDVAAEDLAEFLKGYDIGELLSYKGIAEGVENSNFLLHTSQGSYILTLYEKRVRELAMKGVASRRASLSRMVDRVPFPFCSACCRSCVESGQDLLHGMPYSDIYGLFIRGTTNAVNALAAVEHLEGIHRGHELSHIVVCRVGNDMVRTSGLDNAAGLHD